MTNYKELTLPGLTQSDMDLLAELSNACAVSGNEKEVRKIVRREIEPIADSFEVDILGNAIAIKKSKDPNAVRVMISAHMDEIGFMLVQEEDPGIFRFYPVGGIDPRQMAGKAVLVGPNHIPGVIGTCPVHLLSDEQLEKTIKADDLRIDIGGENKEVTTGMYAYYATKFCEMGGSVCGKALDNRFSVCVLIHMFKECPENVELIAAFTAQEEVGVRGARVAAWDRKPDLAFVLDCTPAMDLPRWDEEESYIYKSKLGEGPAVYTHDGRTLSDPRLIRYLWDTAQNYGIPIQRRQPMPGGTDAGGIYPTQEGIPVVSVSIPGRYAHSAASLARKSDWEAQIQLLYAALANLDKSLLSQPK